MGLSPYLPLDSRKKEIRLLNIWPGRKHYGIVCTVRTVALQDNPVYETLS